MYIKHEYMLGNDYSKYMNSNTFSNTDDSVNTLSKFQNFITENLYRDLHLDFQISY